MSLSLTSIQIFNGLLKQMPAGTVLCLLPATDIRERERLAAVVGIFYADFAVTDEHPRLAGCPPAFLHHIQRVASRGSSKSLPGASSSRRFCAARTTKRCPWLTL